MNSGKYYQLCATIAINHSIVAFIPVFVVILPALFFYTRNEFLLLSIPFFLYSFYSYHLFLLNRYFASKCLNIKRTINKNIIERNENLMTFLPSPTLSLLLFQPDGNLIGKLEDYHIRKIRLFLPKFFDKYFTSKYGIYDHHEDLVYTIVLRKNRIGTIYNSKNEKVVEVFRQKQQNWFIPSHEQMLTVHFESLFLDMKIINDQGVQIARVRRGWMPVEWSDFFPNPNTPVFTINPHATEHERLTLFVLLAYYFRYYDH